VTDYYYIQVDPVQV